MFRGSSEFPGAPPCRIAPGPDGPDRWPDRTNRAHRFGVRLPESEVSGGAAPVAEASAELRRAVSTLPGMRRSAGVTNLDHTGLPNPLDRGGSVRQRCAERER